MKRLLLLWLSLLAVFWLTRSALDLLPGSRPEPRWAGLLAAAAIPAVQALAVGWLTRTARGRLPQGKKSPLRTCKVTEEEAGASPAAIDPKTDPSGEIP